MPNILHLNLPEAPASIVLTSSVVEGFFSRRFVEVLQQELDSWQGACLPSGCQCAVALASWFRSSDGARQEGHV